MPKRSDLKRILVIGSGPIIIGQACEFDYSGTQAVKALREEGYEVILVNSNPATIMTDRVMADRTYIEPITLEYLRSVIAKERPDALLPTIGGQTALNAALELAEAGVLEEFNVELIGASVEAIIAAEDRDRFKKAVANCGLESARSSTVTDLAAGRKAAQEVGFPLIIRPSRTLGGSGGAIVQDESQLESLLSWGFEQSPIGEVLIEESLLGWKEFELEVMRDTADNAVVICSIENIDPMGTHTGDSITVAPVQTLTDKEYQRLRDAALRLMREIGVDTGGSNVQFAVCPRTGRQIVIELNPRVSRSSALASKATGFPIAKIAAKLAVGYSLDELPNDITKKTPACFEPSIDYVVVKIPRFTFEKFADADQTLGTQMKSVGEAMAIGRSFCEALQKACRSLEIDRDGIFGGPESEQDTAELKQEVAHLGPSRLFQAAELLRRGEDIESLYDLTAYDPWFSEQIVHIARLEESLEDKSLEELTKDEVLRLKRAGTSDSRLAFLLGESESAVRRRRHALGLRPAYKTVDTCAAEFSSETPYMYSTYESRSDNVVSDREKIIILGGGPNRIGQGLEFDYCCVHASFALRDAGYETIMVNCNPETVSTDYDTSDRLYFEPLTLEDVLELVEREQPKGVIIQYGGQTPLRLSAGLKAAGVPIIGTTPESIDMTEDREKFKSLLERLQLKQADSGLARNEQEAVEVAEKIGFPLVVRPSFVLGGRAMAILSSVDELRHYIAESVSVSFDRPVLLDRFLDNAIEVDVDAVSDGKDVLVCGVVEHIERAGIHSGDSSFMLPSQTLGPDVVKEIEKATKKLAQGCHVLGLMNVQFAICNGSEIYVLEVNPRASRSVPFVSKVTGVPWAKVAARVMAGERLKDLHSAGVYGDLEIFSDYGEAIKRLPYVAVKEAVFPFVKFRGVDAALGPEMKSTGEVMGVDTTVEGAFSRAHRATGQKLPVAGKVFLSLRGQDKPAGLEIAADFVKLGFSLISTGGTARFLRENGIESERINKVQEGSPHIVDALREGAIDIVVNTPEGTGPLLDSKSIRSTSIEEGVALFTTVAAARIAVKALLRQKAGTDIPVCSLQEYNERIV